MQPLEVFVGHDPREDRAWQVCRHSLLRHAATPLSVTPLRLPELRQAGLYSRPVDEKASTEFSISRYLTPTLARTSGWSLFVDCDFLFTVDVRSILAGLPLTHAVYVVQHDYEPAFDVKMDGQVQHRYPRKNWSSLILFNGDHPKVRALTPEVVNRATPSFLHRFEWLDDGDIGALDPGWNFLVGEYAKPAALPQAIHYTNGGPWFEQWRDVDFADLWLEEEERLLAGSTAARHPDQGLLQR